MTDLELLRQYAENGSQEAFSELVSHHGDWLYSAAFRMVRRHDWADDVTQAVFLLLSQRAAKIKPANLNAWLFNVTRYCALNVLRGENRREKREMQAAIMNRQCYEADQETLWQSVAPVLEESVHRLCASDRDAVLLRFYQRKSMAEVGFALGVSEDTARKRVAKAVGRLRALLSSDGVVVPAIAVAASILAERTTQAAPAQSMAVWKSGAPSAAASRIAQGVNRMLFAFKLKLAAAIFLLAAIPSGLWMALHIAMAAQIAGPPPAAAVAPKADAVGMVQPAAAVDDDVALAPFFNSFTQLIVSANLPKLDLNALQTQERTVLLAAVSADDVRRRSIDRGTVTMRDDFSKTFTALINAGVTHAYPVAAGPPGKGPTGFFVFPAGPNTNIAALDAAIKEPGIESAGGHARIYGAKDGAVTLMMMQQMDAAEARPDLQEALSAGPDQALRIVVVPSALDHVGSFMRVFGLGDYSDPNWQTVKWCRVGLDTSPNLSAQVMIGCQDADSAAAMAKDLLEKFAVRKAAVVSDPLESKIAALLGNLNPIAAGDRVTFNLDEPITQAILAVWYWRDIQQGGSLTKLAIAQAAPQRNPELPVFTPDQLKPLSDAIGKTVIVEGKVSRIIPQQGVEVILFDGAGEDGFLAVAAQEQAPDPYEYLQSPDGSRLPHKKIRLTGRITLLNGKPLMAITDLQQIELIAD